MVPFACSRFPAVAWRLQVALDGQIVSGEANVSTESITGEAVPVRKVRGNELPSGARVEDGALVVKATRPASESTIARIAQLSRQAKVCAAGPGRCERGLAAANLEQADHTQSLPSLPHPISENFTELPKIVILQACLRFPAASLTSGEGMARKQLQLRVRTLRDV